MDRYYKHSGIAPIGSIISTIIIGGLLTVVLSYLYSWATVKVPYIKLRIIITFGYGMLLGGICSFGIKQGKIRNNTVAALMGIILGLLGIYAAWVSWIHIFYGTNGIHNVLVFSPGKIWTIMQEFVENGSWETKSDKMIGWKCYFVWIVEFLIIFLCAMITPLSVSMTSVFCEQTNEWLKNTEVFPIFEVVPNTQEFKSLVENGDLNVLKTLKPLEAQTDNYMQVEMLTGSVMSPLIIIYVKIITLIFDKKGQVKETKTNTLIKNLRVEFQAREIILSLFPKEVQDELNQKKQYGAGFGPDTQQSSGMQQ